MTKGISKSQIDRLGERLKRGLYSEEDLLLLDRYRDSFAAAHDEVIAEINSKLTLEPTSRRRKSAPSIIQKLCRESIRLTQMQDVAGCRIVVNDVLAQDRVIQSLKDLFQDVSIVDRRLYPSHGYRAVHLIVRWQDRLVEVQVRTSLQHLWAEFSEKIADIEGQAIKYGEGDKDIQTILELISSVVTIVEGEEMSMAHEGIQDPKLNLQLESVKLTLSDMFRKLIGMM